MFILVICQHKDGRLCHTFTADGMLAKATVALALMAAILVAGGYSGGCFNPAVGLSQSILCARELGATGKCYEYTWIYTLAPFLAGALAGLASLIMKSIALDFTGTSGRFDKDDSGAEFKDWSEKE